MPSWVGAAHSFFWLHLLDARDLDALTLDSYSGHRAEPFGAGEHNLKGLWNWEQAAIAQSFAGCRTVLIAGAGGGREVVELCRMGFDVAGFDPSPELIHACLGNLESAGLSADMRSTAPGEVPNFKRTFDALLVGRGVYHHLPGHRNRIDFLAACRQQLKPGAPLYLGDFLIRREEGHRLAKLALRKAFERGDHIGSSFFHYFTEAEVREELAFAGFDLVEFRRTPFPGAADRMAHVLGTSKA